MNIDSLLRGGLSDGCDLARDNRGVAVALDKLRADGSAEALSNIDIAVEQLILDYFDDMPQLGVIAEEKLSRDCTPIDGVEWRLVLDPIDGSKYYLRDDGMNVCIMASLLRNRTVVASYVVNIATREVIGFGPKHPDVFLWYDTDFDRSRNLSEQTWPTALVDAKVIMRYEPLAHGDTWAPLLSSWQHGSGPFDSAAILRGSIGGSFTHMWRGFAAAHTQRAQSWAQPWDNIPVDAINRKLGFVCARFDEAGQLVEFEPELTFTAQRRPQSYIVIRRSLLPELRQVVASRLA